MTTIEETFAVLCDVNRRGGIIGHDSSHDEPVRPCPACENVRAAMLQAHSDACTQCLYRSQGAERAECAGYRRIEELK